MSQTIAWIHADNLSPYNPALTTMPHVPAIFVWDEALLAEWQIGLKRIAFIYECLLELPVTIRRGDVAHEVAQFALENNANRIITAESPSPRHKQVCQNIMKHMPKGSQLQVLADRQFVEYDGELDLKRFYRYWEVVKWRVLKPKAP